MTNGENDDGDGRVVADNSMELLMRHSSPLLLDLTTRSNATTTTTTSTMDRSNVMFVVSTTASSSGARNNNTASPSPLRLNRPRSNPRNRTPNRAIEGEEEPQQRQEEVVERRVLQRQLVVENDNDNDDHRMEGRRITIRPMAGAAVGTSIAGTRVSYRAGKGKPLLYESLDMTRKTAAARKERGRGGARCGALNRHLPLSFFCFLFSHPTMHRSERRLEVAVVVALLLLL